MNSNFLPQLYQLCADIHDINYESRYETLKEAIMNKDRGTITWLLKEGCPVNKTELDKHFETPLHIAVFVKDIDIAKVLLAAGAEVNAANFQKQTPLHLAFEMGILDMVDLLLAECDGKYNPFTVYGLSHFHIACVRNNWRVAYSFLERGVNVNVHLEKFFYGKDYVYYRPLHLAVKHENFEVAELLLKYGANVNAKDRYKRTPLHLACRCNYKRLREAIGTPDMSTPQEVMREIRIHRSDQTDIVELLMKYRADSDALDSNDTPPIFHLFKCDYQKIKSAIRSRLSIEDEDFWDEVVEALKAMQWEKFYILIQRDVDVKFCGLSKETLLHLVIDGKKLFVNNSRVGTKQRDLSDQEKAEIVNLLLRYGAVIEAKNASGQTALQMAISSYYVKTVKVLLSYNATVNNVSFFHYKIPKRDAGGNFKLSEMENFLDIVDQILLRKSHMNLNRSNELLMLRYISVESKVQHFENCSISELRQMLDFGDINSIDASLYVSERSVLSNREKISLVLEHIQKLEIAGLYVNENVKREFVKCNNVVDAAQSATNLMFINNCKREIQMLKVNMIDRYASFYDLMFLNVNEVAVRVTSSNFRQSVRVNCNEKFVLYNAVIIKQFVKGLVRSILLNLAKEYLSCIFQFELPDPCSENILSYLKNEDLCNVALAFEN